MDDMEKLRHQLDHWVEHNEGHVKSYAEWAARAEALGRPDLASALRDVAAESARLDALFKRAIALAGPPHEGHGHHHDH